MSQSAAASQIAQSNTSNVIIFLLHGLGPSITTRPSLAPLEWYLNKCGYTNTHRIAYPTSESDLDEMLNYVDAEMKKYANPDTDEVILIGQSMGGVVSNNMHRMGWNIRFAIYIGAPLHGANLLNQLEAVLPTMVRDFLFKKPYELLMNKEHDPIPPHDYHAITMAWPFTAFDGCVYQSEGMLEEDKHTHLPWADHRTVFLNPRLWYHVNNILNKHMVK